ncbi:MAG: hypothetical protein CSYNP_01763 [Syntrophus sp. SKADARSKE-3]|nr:hypothetical protein [Syntrophus sp. SKADARSKE-3]
MIRIEKAGLLSAGYGFWISLLLLLLVMGCSGGGFTSSSPTPRDLSGNVTENGLPLAGVTITISGSTSRSAVTDTNGHYLFSSLDDGTYVLTATFAGYNFSPPAYTVTMSGADGTANFIGTSVGIISTTLHTVYMSNLLTLSTWGNNNHGQIGDGTTSGNELTPYVLPNMTLMSSVAAGDEHTVALAFGTIWAWGSNSNGQLGNGLSGEDEPLPVQVLTQLGPILTGSVAIAAGNAHTLSAMVDGTVWAWGSNSNGQLGDGTIVDESLPVQVLTGPGTILTGIVAVAAGHQFSMALRNDGTIWTWGSNYSGQLGDGDGTTPPTYNTSNDSPYAVQVQALTSTGLIPLSGVTAISAGHDHVTGKGTAHAMALTIDGKVWAWGSNVNGELGDGTTTDRTAAVQVSGLTSMLSIAAGDDHSAAVKGDGTVWTWGNNSKGQLGDGTTVSRLLPAQVAGLGNLMTVATGYKNTIVRKKNGAMWAWGNNSNGQLGNGNTTDQPTPVQIQ